MIMSEKELSVIPWLLDGDVSIQYQTQRDLLEATTGFLSELQGSIEKEGWGKLLFEKRDPVTGLWGNGLYSPKWISTHYTLLELKNLGIRPSQKDYVKSSHVLLDDLWFNGGQIRKTRFQDLCVSAMILSINSYANIQSEKLHEIMDYLLDKQFPDGGWNCRWEKGDRHGSLHTTLSVLEALRDYESSRDSYRLNEVKQCIPAGIEFILKKHLFKSVHTGEIIDPHMLMLSYPCRWRYDILRCMDYFVSVNAPYDERMCEALEIILSKKRKDGSWPVQHKHQGLVHFNMEKAGSASRWNTLRVGRVLKKYKNNVYLQVLDKN